MSPRFIAGKLFARMLLQSGRVKKALNHIRESDQMIGLCFHAPGRQLFESCVTWLTDHGFRCISVRDLENIIDQKQPFPRQTVLITVDDGWQSNLENIAAPARKLKIPVSIFISTEMVKEGNAYWWSYVLKGRKAGLVKESVEYFKTLDNEIRVQKIAELKQKIEIEREALTISQLQEIADNPYVTIGSHTDTHPILPRCSDKRSKQEIILSRETLQSWLHRDINYFAYPNGDYTQREINYLIDAGFTISFTTEQTFITPAHLKNRYQIPRFMMVESASLEENICRMIGVWPVKPRVKQGS